jgi:lysophospholipase L1-like esterase
VRTRLPWAEIGLALASFIAAGLLAELYLRRFHPIRGALYELHPRYLHTLVPGARRLFFRSPRDGGGSVLASVNSDGFMGPELGTRDGARRVVVYGDSFVAGEFSPAGERFATKLADALSGSAAVRFHVTNAGVAGYGPDQVALRLEDELPALDPDLVVVAVFAGNDFGDLLRNKIFRLDGGGGLVSRHPRPSERLRAEFAQARRQAAGSLFLRGLRDVALPPRRTRERSLLPAGGFVHLVERREREYVQSILSPGDLVEHLLGDPYDADVACTPRAESARYKVALMEQVVRRLAETARGHRTPIAFVFIPSAFDAADGFERPDTASFPEYRPRAATDALSAAAERSGLVYLDLYPVFRASPKRLYFHADEHWNAEGQALAAQLAAALLRERGLAGQ